MLRFKVKRLQHIRPMEVWGECSRQKAWLVQRP